MEHQPENRICQNCKQDFIIEPEDFSFYEKIKVPPPTFCPLCRAERRLVFRNERKLFKNKDAFSGENIFSLFPPQSNRKIISQEKWYSDSWDATEYARDYDFSRPFFEQFRDLQKEIPLYNLTVNFMVNSPYCANATALKNSYLIFNSSHSENCTYGNAVDYCKDCVDNSHLNESERCYECFWARKCYQCYFTIMSWDSRNLWFCRDCGGCNDCFGSVNLRGKSYCIFNEQYTKDEYEQKIKEMRLDTIEGLENARKKTREFWGKNIRRHQQGVRNYNSSGSYVTDSKNVGDSFLVREGENMRYCQYMQVPQNRDCYDASFWGANMELNYETCQCGDNSYNLKFCCQCWPSCRDSEYSQHLFSSSNCFGCVGLKKKQYCILNKQYTKEEYEALVPKIKKHMDEMPYIDSKGIIYKYGEFFPIEFSPYGYNNTTAIQHFPLTKEEVLKNNYGWIDRERGEYTITKKAAELPDKINATTDEILQEVIECESCKFAYKILPNELIFYKKENLPVPHLCNECRHERRIRDRLTLHLYERSCMCKGTIDETGIYKNTVAHTHGDAPCGEIFKTGYAPDRQEIVYCEKCYQAEVY